METRPLRFFAEASHGDLARRSPESPVLRVCTDSREIQAGDLFVALVGDRTDGHDYVTEAVGRGAVAAVVARALASRFTDAPLIQVDDTRRALGRMAAAYRAGFALPVVAIGGSNGKTTTKDLTATILGRCFETLHSPESYNNDIGVPATLLGLEDRHVTAVVEVGTNHPGELAPLVRMARPRIGVVTQIGEEHLEFFGSLAGVIEEEGWLAELLPPDGVLILPGDFPWSPILSARTTARVVRVGRAAGNDWRLLDAETDLHGTTFAVRAPRSELNGEYRVNLLGAHQVTNALLAAAVAAEFGLDRDALRGGLAEARPARWRMNRWEWRGVQVIEDCYNANLDSTLAALEALRAFPCAGRRVVVLGGLAELGSHTARAHATVGKRVADLGIERLLAVGETAAISAEAASDAGRTEALAVDSLETAVVSLRNYLRPGDCLLIKGSRAARLERVGGLLRESPHLQHAA